MKASLIENHPSITYPSTQQVHEANSYNSLHYSGKALVIERYSMETQFFIEEFNQATGSSVYHAQTIDEGLRTMMQKRVDIILINLDEQGGEGLRIAERIRAESQDAHIRCPHMIFLSARTLPIEIARRCWKLHVACMLREWWPAIFEEARRALWMRQSRKMNSTILFERAQGHYVLHQCVGISSAHICVPFQPANLAVILAGGLIAYTVEGIAEALGVTRPTVKKYMWELREGSLLAQKELQVLEPDTDIFWMERKAGGTLCGIRANIVWM